MALIHKTFISKPKGLFIDLVSISSGASCMQYINASDLITV